MSSWYLSPKTQKSDIVIKRASISPANHSSMGCSQTNQEMREERKNWDEDRIQGVPSPFSSIQQCHSQQPRAKRYLSLTVLEEECLGKATKDCFISMPQQSGTEGAIPATCRPCAMFVFLPKALTSYMCYKCLPVSLPEGRVKDLRNAFYAPVY